MSANPPQFDLGVLFVHGIGDQKRGSTLVDFGTPVVEWLEGRASGAGGALGIGHTEITPHDAESQADPAHTVISIDAPGVAQRWLMAESWWAESFATPPFIDMALWGFTVAPWAFGAHFGERVRAAWSAPRKHRWDVLWRMPNLVGGFLSLFGGLLLSVVVMIGLALLMAVTFIPWKRLREAVASTQLRLAAWLGDSYVVVARQIEFAAILTKVRGDLAWLAERCQRVAVVAHSQGAAMAWHVLADEHRKAGLLLTLGSGLRKLEQQRELRASPQMARAGALTVTGLLWTGYLPFVLPRVISRVIADFEALSDLGIALIGPVLLAAGLVYFLRARRLVAVSLLKGHLDTKGIACQEFVATADPVPIATEAEQEIVNLMSVIRDHNSYWSNKDVFVSWIGNALLQFADCAPQELVLDRGTINRLTEKRARRVKVLRAAWWLAVAAAALSIVKLSEQWILILDWAQRVVRYRVFDLFGRAHAANVASWINLPLEFLAIIFLGYGVVRLTWEYWNRSEMKKVDPRRYYGAVAKLAMGLVLYLDLQFMSMTILVLLYVTPLATRLSSAAPPVWVFFAVILASVVAAIAAVVWASHADDDPVRLPRPADEASSYIAKVLPFYFLGFMFLSGFGLIVRFGRTAVSRWVPKERTALSIAASIGAFLLVFLALGLVQAGYSWFVRRRARKEMPVDP
jgi:hypothetical protein